GADASGDWHGGRPRTAWRAALRTGAYLAGIDHARCAPQRRQLPRDEERHGAGLEGDRRAGRKVLGVVPAPESLRRRRQGPLRHHLPVPVLDHEHARLAVHVHSHVAFHRAALRLLGAPSRLTPWSTANRIAAEGSPSSLLRLSADGCGECGSRGFPLIPVSRCRDDAVAAGTVGLDRYEAIVWRSGLTWPLSVR